LMRVLAEPAMYSTPLRGGQEFLQQSKRKYGGTARPQARPPTPRFAGELVKWMRFLRAHDQATARRFGALLEGCKLAPLAAAWAQWWPAAQTQSARIDGVFVHQ